MIFSSSPIVDHAAISFSVRAQPSHQPVRASMRHTLLQGLGTASITAPRRAPARR
jgi:hypothetical protein